MQTRFLRATKFLTPLSFAEAALSFLETCAAYSLAAEAVKYLDFHAGGTILDKLNHYRAFEMNALVFCQDRAFLAIMNRVLSQLGLKTNVTADYNYALSMLDQKRIDAVVIDWQEIVDLGDFLENIRKSKLNRESVRVVIARDLLDIRQAFSAGVQFLIHKPASFTQISRCFEAMKGAILRQRRKSHREPVRIPVTLASRNVPLVGATITNISSEGLGLRLNTRTCRVTTQVSAGTLVDFAFMLPETRNSIRGTGRIMWVSDDGDAGTEFQSLSDLLRPDLENWVEERFDRAVARLSQSVTPGSAELVRQSLHL